MTCLRQPRWAGCARVQEESRRSSRITRKGFRKSCLTLASHRTKKCQGCDEVGGVVRSRFYECPCWKEMRQLGRGGLKCFLFGRVVFSRISEGLGVERLQPQHCLDGSRKGSSDCACGWSVVQLQESEGGCHLSGLLVTRSMRSSRNSAPQRKRICGLSWLPRSAWTVVCMLIPTRTINVFLTAKDQDREVCTGT